MRRRLTAMAACLMAAVGVPLTTGAQPPAHQSLDWMSARPLSSQVQPGERETTITGWVIDIDCAEQPELVREITRHKTACALMGTCVRSGYVVLSDTDGQWVRLDAYGNQLVLNALKQTTRRVGLPVSVTGVLQSRRHPREWYTLRVSGAGLRRVEGRKDDVGAGR